MHRNKPQLIALLAFALNGCIGIPLHLSSVEKDLSGKVAAIVAGETKRPQVREALGEPIIASQYWQFDAFRISEWNTGVVVFAGGIPVPVWGREDGYVLAAYDEQGRVADVQYGLRFFDLALGEQPAVVTVRDLQLRATGKEVFLAVPPDRRDRYLQEKEIGDHCRVLVGALQLISDATVEVDGQPGASLPATMNDTLLLLRLAPGNHRIEFPGRVPAIADLQCDAGTSHYIALAPSTDPSVARESSIELHESASMPAGFMYQALLIWGNGQWLVEAEP